VALLLGSAPRALAKSDSVPEWVHAAAAQTLPHYSEETNAVVLLDEVTYTVSPNGQAVEHDRRVVKILRPQGRDEGVIHIGFDKDTKILSMNVWSIGPDGHEYAMKDKDYIDVGDPGLEGAFEFSDDKYRMARAPGDDPGGVIAYDVEQRVRPYITEKTWFFQEDIPSLSRSFTLELPAGYTYGAVWAHHAAVAPVSLQPLRWEMKDTPGIDLDRVPLAPAPESLTGRMTVHYAGPGIANPTDGTWKSIGEWYSQLAKDRLVATPEIAAKAAELTAGKTDFYDKTEAIGEFVQKQIRYVAIELGIGGLQPHAAGDIFRNRYGDCKDKATLLSAMLSTVGIHTALVMVHSERGVVDRDAPSIVGNHMIAAIEIPAGYDSPRLHSVVTAKSGRRYLIFDPTWKARAPLGQLEYDLQGGVGLLIEGAESQAIELPVLDPTLNTIHRSGSFQLDANGGLKGTVVEKRFGDLSTDSREIYTQGDAKQQRDFLDKSLAHDFTVFSVADVKVENADALNREFTVTYSLSAEHYAKSMGSLLMVRPRVLGSVGLSLNHKQRTVPINLNRTMQAFYDYTIELPAGFAVDEIPDSVKIDLGFAAYQSSFEVKGNTLHYTRSYTVRQVTLPVERYADVQRLASAINGDEEGRAVLKKQ
jgi:hypothetical protein